jgi:hypothetical protein
VLLSRRKKYAFPLQLYAARLAKNSKIFTFKKGPAAFLEFYNKIHLPSAA